MVSIGDRIVYGEKRGTIQFVGEVPPFAGTWYGVDWDNWSDGKHDGSYKGIRYFYASHPTSGSFVKSTEVNHGTTFVNALKEQYYVDLEQAREDYEESMKDFAVSVFNFANLEKVKGLHGPLATLQIVNLSSYNVNSPGEYGEIQQTCPNIVDLDLSSNLMTSWESIVTIAEQLKQLRILTLNDCKLKIPDYVEKHVNGFENLQHMSLCRTPYSWDDILILAKMWPRLQVLKVSFCNITTFVEPIAVLQHLRHIDIQGNKIHKWSEINKLGHLKLEVLNACDTGLTEIILPQNDRLFQQLHTLYVSENFIQNYSDIIDLNNLPRLKDLRINKNPITNVDKFLTHREKIIARIGNLKILNGCEIKPDERRSAEYDYLREYATDWSQCVNDEKEKAKFSSKHPRYIFLVQKHGPADAPTEIDPSLKGHLITVNLVCDKENGTQEIIKKRVHLSLAVYKLITIAKRAFKMSDTCVNLVRISAKNPAIKVDMCDQLKAMNVYAVEDGDTIHINRLQTNRGR